MTRSSRIGRLVPIRRTSYPSSVALHRDSELRGALDVVGSLFDPVRPEPFGLETLALLGELVGAETVGYCESPQRDGSGGYELVTRERDDSVPGRSSCSRPARPHAPGSPPELAGADRDLGFVSRSTFQTTPMYEAIFEPLGIADSIRVHLPAPQGEARFFFFDRSTWGLPARERELLGILRGHLLRARTEWHPFEQPVTASLTEREAQILGMVAEDSQTSRSPGGSGSRRTPSGPTSSTPIRSSESAHGFKLSGRSSGRRRSAGHSPHHRPLAPDLDLERHGALRACRVGDCDEPAWRPAPTDREVIDRRRDGGSFFPLIR